jgi:hypothetical protein
VLARDDLLEGGMEGPALLHERTDIAFAAELFRHQGRGRLLYRLEAEISRGGVDRVLAVGVRRAGYVAGLAAHLQGIPFILVATYADAFEHYLSAAVEIEACCANAAAIVVPNDTVAWQLAAFQELGNKCSIVDPDPIEVEPRRPEQGPVCTTGALGGRTDLQELILCIKEVGADRGWRHIGFVEDELREALVSELEGAGLDGRFEETGLLPVGAYRNALKQCSLLVKARGYADTGASIREALALGVPVNVHCEHPVRPESELLTARGRSFGSELQRPAFAHCGLEESARRILQ